MSVLSPTQAEVVSIAQSTVKAQRADISSEIQSRVTSATNALASGVANLKPGEAIPAGVKIAVLSVAGTYAQLSGITVSNEDLLAGQVRAELNIAGVWEKRSSPIANLGAYVLRTDVAAQLGFSIPFSDLEIGGMSDSTGLNDTSTLWNRTPKVFVVPGQRIKFTLRVFTAYMWFFDINDVLLLTLRNTLTTAQNITGEIDAPAGTAYFRCETQNSTNLSYAPYTFNLEVVGSSYIKDTQITGTVLTDASLGLGRINATTGANDTNNETIMVRTWFNPIPKFATTMTYTLMVHSNGAKALFFFDSADTLITSMVTSDTGTTKLVSGTVNIPNNATKYRVQSVNTSSGDYVPHTFSISFNGIVDAQKTTNQRLALIDKGLVEKRVLTIEDLTIGNLTAAGRISGGTPLLTYSHTDFEDIEENVVVDYTVMTKDFGIIFLDKNKDAISRHLTAADFTVFSGSIVSPTGTKFIRVQTMNSAHASYVPYIFNLSFDKPKSPAKIQADVATNITYYTGKKIVLAPRQGFYPVDIFPVDSGNLQGIVYNAGKVYISYDIDLVNTRFVVYDYVTGKQLKVVPSLPCGHGADLDYDITTGTLFVSTYGSSTTMMHAVDIESPNPTIVRTYPDKQGQISVDGVARKLFMSYLDQTSGNRLRITVADMDTGVNEAPFFFPCTSAPYQGSAYNNGKLYVLQGSTSTAMKVYVVDIATKTLDNTITFPNISREPEGFAIVNDVANPYFLLSYRDASRLTKLHIF